MNHGRGLRQIPFPENSVGTLQTLPDELSLVDEEACWQVLGPASGLVVVPPSVHLRLNADTSAFSMLNSVAPEFIESIVDGAPWSGHYENFRPPMGLLQLHVLGFGLHDDPGYMIDDDSLCAIANTRSLLDLDLTNNQVTDDGIVFLRNLWDLRKLDLSNHDYFYGLILHLVTIIFMARDLPCCRG